MQGGAYLCVCVCVLFLRFSHAFVATVFITCIIVDRYNCIAHDLRGHRTFKTHSDTKYNNCER